MGNLTKDMTRLCQEIGGWRRDRGQLCQKMARDAKTLKVEVQHLRKETKKAQSHLAKVARADRLSFVSDLMSQVSHLRQGHRQAFQQMGAENGARRRAFVPEMQGQVGDLQAGFRKSHAEMARQGRTTRRQFLSRLESTVSALRREAADDLNGARRAFFGPSQAAKVERAKPAAELEHRAKEAKKSEKRK
jgi:hypothetical protein